MLNCKFCPLYLSGSSVLPPPALGGFRLCLFGLICVLVPLQWMFFSAPFSFRPVDLPPFYKSLALAWSELGGAFSAPHSSLVFGAADPLFCLPVCSMTTKSCYLFLLSKRLADHHCVEKFAPTFGALYWPTTWQSLSFFDLDHQVIDLNWKIAQGCSLHC